MTAATRPKIGLFALSRMDRASRIGGALFAALAAAALFGPWLLSVDPAATEPGRRLLSPGAAGHLLGTDQLGRDVLSRLLHGTRLSLGLAFVGSGSAVVLGSVLGLISGYFGGRIDALLMRLTDVVLAFPYLLLALAIVAALGPGLGHATLAIVIVNIPFFARTVRGVTLSLREEPFVLAARVGGLSGPRLIVSEILPNVLSTIVVAASTSVGWVLLETAGLSFLGLGAQPPQADLGGMLGQGRHLIAIAPHVCLFPGGMILLIVLGLNLLGDGLRDALDPRRSGADGRTATPLPAAPRSDPEAAPAQPARALVRCERLTLDFRDRRVLDDVSFFVGDGERVALVGESGSGKSMTVKALLGLLPPGARASARRLSVGPAAPLASPEEARRVRGRIAALVPQDPMSSLHPLFPVGRQIAECLVLGGSSAREAERHAVSLLEEVGIPDPERRARAYPHELSGGMRQRVALAMALANGPKLLLADEPTTALDVTTQARILSLLRARSQGRGMALLFITHDLAVASELCDRVLIMHRGTIVEAGPILEVFDRPRTEPGRRLVAGALRRGAAA